VGEVVAETVYREHMLSIQSHVATVNCFGNVRCR
jgi:hypothetical protein